MLTRGFSDDDEAREARRCGGSCRGDKVPLGTEKARSNLLILSFISLPPLESVQLGRSYVIFLSISCSGAGGDEGKVGGATDIVTDVLPPVLGVAE